MNLDHIIRSIIDAPVLLKVISALLAILVVHHFAKNLVIAMLSGTALLALWSGHSPDVMADICIRQLTSLNLILILVVLCGVIWFSTQMTEAGIIRDMVEFAQLIFPKRFSVALLPAVIGLLPMPGGALISAPLVDDCDTCGEITPVLKTRINYWFRHIWEYWWPMYPGVILAIEITRLPMWQFLLLQLPMSLFSIIGGYIFLLRKVGKSPVSGSEKKEFPFLKIISITLPFLIIFAAISARLFIPALSKVNNSIPMIAGIIIAMIALQMIRPLPLQKWKTILLSKKVVPLVLIVASAYIYAAFIDARLPEGIHLADKMRMELYALGIPLLFVIIIIPFISGLVSGIAIGFVGASFPIIISMIGQEPQMGIHLSTVLLAYVSGYIGMMLSPVHVCFIVTAEYYKTRLGKSLAGLFMPALVVFTGAILLYMLIRFVLFA